MSKIEVGRFSTLLRRFLEQKGDIEVAGELAPEISAVFVLESDRPDWHFLKNEKLISSGALMTVAGATAGPTYRLRNPAGSGLIITIDSVDWTNTVASDYQWRVEAQTADLPVTGISSVTRDTRWTLITSAMIATVSITAGPTGILLFGQSVGIIATPFEKRLPIVLTPGFALNIGSSTVGAKTGRVTVNWTERRLPAIEAE